MVANLYFLYGLSHILNTRQSALFGREPCSCNEGKLVSTLFSTFFEDEGSRGPNANQF